MKEERQNLLHKQHVSNAKRTHMRYFLFIAVISAICGAVWITRQSNAIKETPISALDTNIPMLGAQQVPDWVKFVKDKNAKSGGAELECDKAHIVSCSMMTKLWHQEGGKWYVQGTDAEKAKARTEMRKILCQLGYNDPNVKFDQPTPDSWLVWSRNIWRKGLKMQNGKIGSAFDPVIKQVSAAVYTFDDATLGWLKALETINSRPYVIKQSLFPGYGPALSEAGLIQSSAWIDYAIDKWDSAKYPKEVPFERLDKNLQQRLHALWPELQERLNQIEITKSLNSDPNFKPWNADRTKMPLTRNVGEECTSSLDCVRFPGALCSRTAIYAEDQITLKSCSTPAICRIKGSPGYHDACIVFSGKNMPRYQIEMISGFEAAKIPEGGYKKLMDAVRALDPPDEFTEDSLKTAFKEKRRSPWVDYYYNNGLEILKTYIIYLAACRVFTTFADPKFDRYFMDLTENLSPKLFQDFLPVSAKQNRRNNERLWKLVAMKMDFEWYLEKQKQVDDQEKAEKAEKPSEEGKDEDKKGEDDDKKGKDEDKKGEDDDKKGKDDDKKGALVVKLP